MIILGLNAYHGDSAACLVRDGQLVAAAEEERFRRVKHWAGLPTEAIKFCLHEAGLRFGDLGIGKDRVCPHSRAECSTHKRRRDGGPGSAIVTE